MEAGHHRKKNLGQMQQTSFRPNTLVEQTEAWLQQREAKPTNWMFIQAPSFHKEETANWNPKCNLSRRKKTKIYLNCSQYRLSQICDTAILSTQSLSICNAITISPYLFQYVSPQVSSWLHHPTNLQMEEHYGTYCQDDTPYTYSIL